MQSTVCSESAARCLSKSYMALPISVFAVEIAGDVLADCRLDRGEAGVVAHAEQMFDLCFGEILVLVPNCLGHVDIFNIGRPAKRLEHGADHVAKALRMAGAHIED